jgi:peptidoglycan/LPS O-acetylase OafA/YrhL
MIQRQQTLWLLLSMVCSFLSFQFPFYSGTKTDGTFAELEGGSNFFLLVTTGISLLLSLIAVFLYKDRKMQLKLAIGGAVLSILILILYFVEMRSFAKGNIAITCIFVLAIIAGYIMAARGIWKDEKLVKSLDKLR